MTVKYIHVFSYRRTESEHYKVSNILCYVLHFIYMCIYTEGKEDLGHSCLGTDPVTR